MSSSSCKPPCERCDAASGTPAPRAAPDGSSGEAALEVRSDLDTAYREHGGALFRFIRREAGAQDTPDLVQEVFARAAGSEQRHSLANPGGFLRRIAQNLLVDRARRTRRQGPVSFPLQEETDVGTPPQQEWNMAADDLLRIYERAVDAMPPKTRRVFLMHRVDELSYREIHLRLGISVATVEYHMMKALSHLADLLDHKR